jgi:CubicO group peptidase (beta-lactamase class C family)
MVDRRRVMKRMANAYRWDTDLKGNIRDRLREVREEVKSHYGAISTILDLARWEAELYDPQILNRKSLEAMFTPHKEEKGLAKHPKGYRWGYGFGWFWSKLDGQVILSHSGITGTYYMRIPDKETSLVLLTNQSRLADDGDLLPKIGLNIMRKYRSGILRPAWREYMPGHIKTLSKEWI